MQMKTTEHHCSAGVEKFLEKAGKAQNPLLCCCFILHIRITVITGGTCRLGCTVKETELAWAK